MNKRNWKFCPRLKFRLSEKDTKFEKNLPHALDLNVQSMRKIAQIFVNSSEIPNFIRAEFFKFFLSYLGNATTSYFHSEISWPLYLPEVIVCYLIYIFCVFTPFLNLYRTAPQPYRLSHINALCINQSSKDQSMKFFKKFFWKLAILKNSVSFSRPFWFFF